MHYLDTSLLAPLVRTEPSSEGVARLIGGLAAGELATSRWTEVEFASFLAREVRMSALRADEARTIESVMAKIIEDSFVVLLPRAEDYALAASYLHVYETGLRAGDALHLAIAGNHRATTIWSLDRRMVEAGRMLGLPTRIATGPEEGPP